MATQEGGLLMGSTEGWRQGGEGLVMGDAGRGSS